MRKQISIYADTAFVLIWWFAIRILGRLKVGAIMRARAGDNRRALFVSWWLPPMVSPGTHRPASQIKYGMEIGWRLSVIAGPAPETVSTAGEYLARSMPVSLEAIRVSPPALTSSWRLTPRLHGDAFIDALAMAWAGMVRFRSDPPEIVVASGPPFSTFVAAFYLAEFYSVPLVLDYRDLWSECQFGYYNVGRDFHAWERMCLARASAVIFTTNAQLKHQLKTFDVLSRDRCHVVENGWEPEDIPKASVDSTLNDGLIRLSFVGTLTDHSSPLPFLNVLSRVLARRADIRARVRIRLVGLASREVEATLMHEPCRDVIERIDYVSKPHAFDLMRSSAALLIFAVPGLAMYRPGKIYDYLATGRPILVYGHSGETSELVRTLGIGRLVAEGDDIALERAIDDIVAGQFATWSASELSAWLSERTREVLARKFFSIIERLIETRSCALSNGEHRRPRRQ